MYNEFQLLSKWWYPLICRKPNCSHLTNEAFSLWSVISRVALYRSAVRVHLSSVLAKLWNSTMYSAQFNMTYSSYLIKIWVDFLMCISFILINVMGSKCFIRKVCERISKTWESWFRIPNNIQEISCQMYPVFSHLGRLKKL